MLNLITLRLRMKNYEDNIQSAIDDQKNGSFTCQRAAAIAYGIPRSTIQSILDGRACHSIS